MLYYPKYHPIKETDDKQSNKHANEKIKIKTKKPRTSHPPYRAFMGDSIGHNIAQMTSSGKAYIPWLLVIIIN